METAKRLDNVTEYFFSKKLAEIEVLKRTGAQIINLGIGSPDLAPPPKVVDALCAAAQRPDVHGYQSYKGILPFRNAIKDWYARWYNVSLDAEKEILPLMGSKEGIVHVCMTYLGEGDKALVPDPGYPTYSTAVRLAGATPVEYTLLEKNNWLPDFEELEKSDLRNVKLMWVNYTHMPTGKKGDAALFERLIAFGKKHDILICHDNPYGFILNDEPLSIMSLAGAKDHALELNSLSKTYNMAGWRIGMLVSNENVVQNVLRFKSNMDSGMFLPVQLAAIEALKTGKEWHEANNEVYKRRKEKVLQLIKIIGGVAASDQSGLFVWAKIPADHKTGIELCDHLLYEKHIFITPGSVFGNAGNNYFRISLCNTESVIDEAIKRIQ